MKLGTKNCHFYHGFIKLGTKNCSVSLVFVARTSTCSKRVCTFCKKKTWCTMGFLQTCKKTFFRVSKNVKPQLFFFFSELWDFSEKLREKKHKFHFQIAKILNFVHKKNVFSNFTLVHRHLLNSRETVSSFTAVSLKLTWNSKNGQSFTETGCQKYGVFGMKSAKSTVS